jgi:hypothetical protein
MMIKLSESHIVGEEIGRFAETALFFAGVPHVQPSEAMNHINS